MSDKTGNTAPNNDKHRNNPMDSVNTKPVPTKEERSGDKNNIHRSR